MVQSRKRLLTAVAVLLAAAHLGSIFIVHVWLYTAVHLAIAKGKGIYATPEDGMRALCAENRYATVTKIEIDRAGVDRHDGRHPHVWFVIAKVWADKRPDGRPVPPRGYYYPGRFFIRVREGWVNVPEISFPHLLGAYMVLLGLA